VTVISTCLTMNFFNSEILIWEEVIFRFTLIISIITVLIYFFSKQILSLKRVPNISQS